MTRFPITRKALEDGLSFLVIILFSLLGIIFFIPVSIACFLDVEIFEPGVSMWDCRVMKTIDRWIEPGFKPSFERMGYKE